MSPLKLNELSEFNNHYEQNAAFLNKMLSSLAHVEFRG